MAPDLPPSLLIPASVMRGRNRGRGTDCRQFARSARSSASIALLRDRFMVLSLRAVRSASLSRLA